MAKGEQDARRGSFSDLRNGIAALDWLAEVFGFTETARFRSSDGRLSHGEMSIGDGLISWAKAWFNRDRAMVERIIAPEWMSTYPDGHMTDRLQCWPKLSRQAHKILGLNVEDVKVRLFGDAAVVMGRTHGVGELEGNGYDVVYGSPTTCASRKPMVSRFSHASLVHGP